MANSNLPSTTKAWQLTGYSSDFSSLQLTKSDPIPTLGPSDVLVQIHYVSLNYRDLIIAKVTSLLFPASLSSQINSCHDTIYLDFSTRLS